MPWNKSIIPAFSLLVFVGLLLWIGSNLSSCGVYSLSGASIPDSAQTVQVDFIRNDAQLVNPTLSQVFTDKLRNKFISETRLKLTPQAGDLCLSGHITGYAVTSVGQAANQQVSMNRLTITVTIKYTNKFDPKQNFETSFSNFADFASTSTLSAVEGQLMLQITESLVQDIFNRSVNNW